MNSSFENKSSLFNKLYTCQSVLGKGAFATVYLMTRKSTGKNCAVKVICKKTLNNEKLKNLRNEALILSKLNHPNIVQFEEVIESDTKIYIVMEYVQNGTLFQSIVKHLLLALEYIHSLGIVHRDIKPENILLSSLTDFSGLKLADYGLSTCFYKEDFFSPTCTEQCGTIIYMAPEIFLQRIYSRPVDVFSVGVILYELTNNAKHPFYKRGMDKRHYLRRLISKSKFKHSQNNNNLFNEFHLFMRLCARDPQDRYIAAQALKHPWVTQNNQVAIPLTFNETEQAFQGSLAFGNVKKKTKNLNGF